MLEHYIKFWTKTPIDEVASILAPTMGDGVTSPMLIQDPY